MIHLSVGGVFTFDSSILLLTSHFQTVFPRAYENVWQKQVSFFIFPFSNVNRNKRTACSSAEALLASNFPDAYPLDYRGHEKPAPFPSPKHPQLLRSQPLHISSLLVTQPGTEFLFRHPNTLWLESSHLQLGPPHSTGFRIQSVARGDFGLEKQL